MKHAIAVIAFVVLLLSTSSSSPAYGQPKEWALSVTSGGAPWEKRFVVEMNHTGLLSVAEEDRSKLPNDPRSKLTVQLSAKEVKEIYDQALRALFTTPPRRPYEIADGTMIQVKLEAPGRASMRGFHVGVTEEEAPQVAKLFALINKHLPTEHHIY